MSLFSLSKQIIGCGLQIHAQSLRHCLEDEHAVAVGEEAVFFGDGLLVGFHDEVLAGEGGDEHDEGGFGEVEVGK